MLDLVAVGDVMLDVFVTAPQEGATIHAPVRVQAGGSAVNAALRAARAGASAAVVGRVGDDPGGVLIAEELRRADVWPLLAVDDSVATGSVAYVGGSAVAERGANARFAPGDVPAAVREARIVLVSGYLLFHADSGPGAAAALKRAGGLRAVDLASAGLAREVDADVIFGPPAAVARLEPGARPGRIVVTTLGAEGARATRDGETAEAPPPAVLDASPVGAGDAFAALFLLALADGASLEEALTRACAL